jgi:hypothetical protein
MASHRSTSRRARALAVVVVLTVTAAACANSTGSQTTGERGGSSAPSQGTALGSDAEAVENTSPGVTDDEIRFASFGTRSNNPLGTCLADCFDAGVNAYFAWRNSEGGVHGRSLVLAEQLDDQLAQNKERALELVSADDTFGAFSAPLLATGFEDMAEAGIPLYTYAVDFTSMAGRPGIYGDRPVICVICTSRFFPYIATVTGAERIASIGYGSVQAPKDCVNSTAASVERYSDETGQTVAYRNDELEFGMPNGIGPEVTAMKDAGVDLVVTCMDLNGVKTVEQEMERQGMGAVPVVHNDSYDATFIADGKELFEGDIIQTSFRPFEADAGNSQLNTFKEWMDKTGQPLTEIALQGWINADLAYQGIEAAGPSFTRERVIEATNQFTDFTAGGLIPPIDWSRQHEPWTDEDPTTHGYAIECRSFLRVKDGAFEMIGPADEPFTCFDPSNQDWVEPTSEDFE